MFFRLTDRVARSRRLLSSRRKSLDKDYERKRRRFYGLVISKQQERQIHPAAFSFIRSFAIRFYRFNEKYIQTLGQDTTRVSYRYVLISRTLKKFLFVRRGESEIEADKLREDRGRVNRIARFNGRTLVGYDRARVWREDVKSESVRTSIRIANDITTTNYQGSSINFPQLSSFLSLIVALIRFHRRSL